MSKRVIIIGGKGKGGPIDNCITDNQKYFSDYEFEVAGYLNDFETGSINQRRVLGTLSILNDLLKENYYFIFAIHLIGRNYLTESILKNLNIPEERLATVISKRAFISDSALVGAGSVVLPFAYLSLDVKIGNSSMIMAGTMVGHDTKIGDNCFIGAGSVIGSLVDIGNNASISLGTTIIENCKIGNNSVLGAGSTLISDIPSGQIFVGNPARYIKDVKNHD